MLQMPYRLMPASLALLAGCGTVYQHLSYPAAEAATLDARYAYLIVDSRVVPAMDGQETWIHIRKFGGGIVELAAGTPVYAVVPERYEVTRVHGAQAADADIETRFFRQRIRFRLKPGIAYYLGMFEIRSNGGAYTVQVVQDQDLYQRACYYAPAVLEHLPLAQVLDEHRDVVFPPCSGGADDDQMAQREGRL